MPEDPSIPVGYFRVDHTVGSAIAALDARRGLSLGAARKALRVASEQLLRDSRMYVPVLTGQLKDSGRVEELPSLNEAMRVLRVIYGNANVLYAWLQHEVPYNHPSLGFTGRAKYLEIPLTQNWQYYMAVIAAEYEAATGA